MDLNWYIQLVKHSNGKVHKEMGPYVSEEAARKDIDPLMTWLDYKKFFVRVTSREEDESIRHRADEKWM